MKLPIVGEEKEKKKFKLNGCEMREYKLMEFK